MGSHVNIMRDWPATLDARAAVDYSGLAPAEIQKAEREGRLSFKPLGPRGRKVVLRSQLDAMLATLFAARDGQPLEDMDFGDD